MIENSSHEKINFIKKISVKVTFLVLIILSIGIGVAIYYFVQSQNSAIIGSKEISIDEESSILYTAIKNNMLAGEAPIAVGLFDDFSKMTNIGEIKLFRKNGVTAFSDNTTLEQVNKNLKTQMFSPKTEFIKKEKINNENFNDSANNIKDVIHKDIQGEEKKLTIYKVLVNQPQCSKCHGLYHEVRGVIQITTPVDEVYEQAENNIILSVIIYGIVVIILAFAILLFLHKLVIRRVYKIGHVVSGVGEGDFKTKIHIEQSDEIGVLSHKINTMIDGLYERFKLTKFVSKSTLDHVKGSSEISLGGEKKEMTVLFSDIRGFTNYSEKRDPSDVIMVLNEVMNLQGEIVHDYQGDIDKFVGDELMAIFEGENMVLRAIQCAEKIRQKMKSEFSGGDKEIYIGIGINTGEMISGNMGSGDRLDRTVIGDAVNLGARLCSIAGRNTIILSEFSYAHVKDHILVNEHDSIKVKGKDNLVKIYTLRRTL